MICQISVGRKELGPKESKGREGLIIEMLWQQSLIESIIAFTFLADLMQNSDVLLSGNSTGSYLAKAGSLNVETMLSASLKSPESASPALFTSSILHPKRNKSCVIIVSRKQRHFSSWNYNVKASFRIILQISVWLKRVLTSSILKMQQICYFPYIPISNQCNNV